MARLAPLRALARRPALRARGFASVPAPDDSEQRGIVGATEALIREVKGLPENSARGMYGLSGAELDALRRRQVELENERRMAGAEALRETLAVGADSSEMDIVVPEPMSKITTVHGHSQNENWRGALRFRLDVEQAQLPVQSIDKHVRSWLLSLTALLEKEHGADLPRRGWGADRDAASVLNGLPKYRVAEVVVMDLLHIIGEGADGGKFVTAALRVGNGVRQLATEALRERSGNVWGQMMQRAEVKRNTHSGLERRTLDRETNLDWPTELHAKVGGRLLHLAMRSCFLCVNEKAGSKPSEPVPAFQHGQITMPGQRQGIVVAHPALIINAKDSPPLNALMDQALPNIRPMVCPPLDWVTPFRGGFLATRMPMIRCGKEGNEVLMRFKPEDCSELLDCLSALGRVPWQLNPGVYETAKRVQDEDLGVTGLPVRTGDKADDLAKRLAEPKPKRVDGESLRNFRRRVREHAESKDAALRQRQEWASRHMDFRAKLDLADFVKDYKQFWFPHSLDFRGRAYPIPPVSHMGDDLARSLLRFKNARPLGERGVHWLKVHLANQFGVDKVSFADRVKWTDNNMEEILRSAREPLDATNPTKRQLWATADNPWQALATCMELYNAMTYGGRPEDFHSHLPVHQDGSCNGLQHYAALGRDLVGGEQVNLVPGPKPGDVYTAVANEVRKTLTKLAEGYDGNNPFESRINQRIKEKVNLYLASVLKDKITRKLVKQTVMTSVYGVTFLGARDQIERRLVEANNDNKLAASRGEPHGTIMEDREVSMAAVLLAETTLDSIGTTFTAAKHIQSWLGQLARASTRRHAAVAWVTPLGLPVIQPYREFVYSDVKTTVQGARIGKPSRKISAVKQHNAFPPNYVHSIDSTHMLMTARRCEALGLDFTAVHDSYWTHAGETDVMNRVLRESFVDLHRRPLLEDLRQQFVARFPQEAHRISPPPAKGELDIEKVLESPYFFA